MYQINTKRFSRIISIETNQQCNLHCVYCYEIDRSALVFDIDKIKKIVTKLLSKPTPLGTVIDLHGGEPFLVFKQIKELCIWLWSQNFDEDFIVHVTTNGTLVHNDIQKWLFDNKEKIVLKLSLDGNSEAHNINRCNSFDKIDLSFFIKTWPNEGVKMTISPESLHLMADSIVYLHSIGFVNIQADLADVSTWNKDTDAIILLEQFDALNTFYLNSPNIKLCSLYNIPFDKCFDNSPKKYAKACTTGCKIAIDIHGDKYPCHVFFPSESKSSKLMDFLNCDFDKESTFVSDKCFDCEINFLCSTCYGSNIVARDAINHRDSNRCTLEKVRISQACVFYYNRIIKALKIEPNDYRIMLALKQLEKFIHKTLSFDIC